MVYSVVLGMLLVLLWLQPILLVSPTPELCKSLNTLNASLSSSHRRHFMKHNFPVNYTIRVHPQEVFRLHNINKLKAQVPQVELQDLQDLWLLVNQEVLKKVLRVLPERHPSRRYVSNLEQLLRMVQQVQQVQQEEREPPEEIREIWLKLRNPNSKVWKWVTPKSLLDSCFRTMHCLFADCFLDHQYCNLLYWKKEKRQTVQG